MFSDLSSSICVLIAMWDSNQRFFDKSVRDADAKFGDHTVDNNGMNVWTVNEVQELTLGMVAKKSGAKGFYKRLSVKGWLP